MSYTKREWATGNVVGAVDLNRIEDRIANVDVGYSCSEGWVTLTEESVATTVNAVDLFASGDLTYSERITADTIKVTFNDTEYNNVPVVVETAPSGTFYSYGAPWSDELADYDFSTYPFAIESASLGNMFQTENAGTYQVKIETLGEVIETSECFDKARGYSCIESVTTYIDGLIAFE